MKNKISKSCRYILHNFQPDEEAEFEIEVADQTLHMLLNNWVIANNIEYRILPYHPTIEQFQYMYLEKN